MIKNDNMQMMAETHLFKDVSVAGWVDFPKPAKGKGGYADKWNITFKISPEQKKEIETMTWFH